MSRIESELNASLAFSESCFWGVMDDSLRAGDWGCAVFSCNRVMVSISELHLWLAQGQKWTCGEPYDITFSASWSAKPFCDGRASRSSSLKAVSVLSMP